MGGRLKIKRFLVFLTLVLVQCQAAAFYNPKMGRWTTRDPIEEEGGANLYRFCDNSPVSKIDPRGEDVYVYTGNNTGNFINDSLHQTIAVDVWSDGCPPRKIGVVGFSFGYNGNWKWNWPKATWLGYDSFTLPGFLMEGEIYEADVVGRVVKRKEPTPSQDRAWLKRMRERVGTKDVYSVGRHNCINFAQREFELTPTKQEGK